MSKSAAGWIIFIVILAGICVGLWVAVNGGFTGTLQGTIDKIYAMLNEVPAESPPLMPGIERPPIPGTEKPDETAETPKAEFPEVPFLGVPGLGIPPLKSEPEKSEPTPAAPKVETGAQEPVVGGLSLSTVALKTPTDVLRACVDALKRNDLVGAENYVSPGGLAFKMGSTIGVHEVLWKGLFSIQAYQGIGYNATKASGQTALIPLYADLGDSRVVVAYVVMAHRGDGWKVDHITDPSRF